MRSQSMRLLPSLAHTAWNTAQPVAVDLGQTRGTVHRLGGKIPRAIKSPQIVAIKERHRFQRLAALPWPKDTLEHRPEHLGGDRVKDFAHVRVARDPRNAVDGVQIALGPCLVEGEERRRFEGKHGKGRHERIAYGNLGIVQTVIRQAGKTAVHQAERAHRRRDAYVCAAQRWSWNTLSREHRIVQVRGYFRIWVYERPGHLTQ